MEKKITEMPKDLDIEIGNPDQMFWEDMKEKFEKEGLASKRQDELRSVINKYADKRIAEEKAKFKDINEKLNK